MSGQSDSRVNKELPDFEAEIRFYTFAEGGRRSPVFQGYRPDISYDEGPVTQLYMVWPRFLDDEGGELTPDVEVPRLARANFYIVVDESRTHVHAKRIQPGTRFYICEGPKKVAECRVTRLLNLLAACK